MSTLVVVGVDGSEASLAAVETAAREARWRKAALKVVHAFVWPGAHTPPVRPDGLTHVADDLVAEAVERARSTAPDIEVAHTVVTGDPLSVLEQQSHTAELLVVGSRGSGAFAALLLGSTALHLATHSRCPVLVVRDQPRADGPVVVGVDGSEAGQKAVDFAFAEAAQREAPLIALHAWTTWSATLPAPQDPSEPYAYPSGALAGQEERLLAEAIAGREERYPQVRVERRLVHGPTREALIDASADAQLVVVGARGRGGFAGLLLGSVSQAVLHHAHCPVAVVRGEKH
jgi:nucleotide-binding universal stress UspA family protein